MRAAAALSDWAMAAYREEMKPGRLLAELDYRICERLAVEAARRVPGENYVISRLRTLSGPTSACPHGDDRPTGRRVEPNSIAITTLVTRLNGLSMELTRPFLVGAPPEEAAAIVRAAAQARGIRLQGLMVLPPWSADPEETRPWFVKLREFRDRLLKEEDVPSSALGHLSMGMSHDYEAAIEEGATLVRVGTAIFGARQSTHK